MAWRDEHSSGLCPLASSSVCFLWWCVHITDVLSNASICNLSSLSLSQLSLSLSAILGSQFSLSVSIWVSLLKFKHLAPKQPFVSNLADRATKIDENTSRNEEERGRKKHLVCLTALFAAWLEHTHTHTTPRLVWLLAVHLQSL